MHIPKLVKIRQRFDDRHVGDVEKAVRDEFARSAVKIPEGARIAVAVGSRGIDGIDRIVKTVVQCVRERGGAPFIIPAMGSHGGATAEGQRKVLEGYGITEEYTGAPIMSSMETVELPRGDLPNSVYYDKFAYEADGTVIINRIKPHTSYHAAYESGLIKMSVIGLGKHKAALEIHSYGVYGLKELMPATARQVLKHGNIIAGLAIVENAYDRAMAVRMLKPEEFEEEEPKLLKLSYENMPRLPVNLLDVLVVDEMGKNISGLGMDPNVIGRLKIRGEPEPQKPVITNIVVADLTEETRGNAAGMGLADFTTRKLFEKIDFRATYENVLTSTFTERGKVPIIADNAALAVEYAIRTCRLKKPGSARIARIRNTLRLDELYVSSAAFDDLMCREGIEIIGDFADMFMEDGTLAPF